MKWILVKYDRHHIVDEIIQSNFSESQHMGLIIIKEWIGVAVLHVCCLNI